MPEINLVPEETRKSEDLDKLRGKVTLASVAILVLTAVGAIVTLAFFTYFVSQRGALEAKREKASAIINQYKSAEELLVVTKDKAAVADKLVQSRVDFLKFYGTLVEIIPQRVSFTTISVGREGVDFSGKAGSSADIAGLVSALTSAKGSEIVSTVVVNSLVADETREYSFSISAQLVE